MTFILPVNQKQVETRNNHNHFTQQSCLFTFLLIYSFKMQRIQICIHQIIIHLNSTYMQQETQSSTSKYVWIFIIQLDHALSKDIMVDTTIRFHCYHMHVLVYMISMLKRLCVSFGFQANQQLHMIHRKNTLSGDVSSLKLTWTCFRQIMKLSCNLPIATSDFLRKQICTQELKAVFWRNYSRDFMVVCVYLYLCYYMF